MGLKNLMVVNEDMLITGLSEAGTDFFEKETFIFQYNKRFRSIFNSFNYVANFRLKNSTLDLESLMEDDLILEHCRVYFNFLNGDEVVIVDKNGFKRQLYMKIAINLMPTVNKYIQFVEFELSNYEELRLTTLGDGDFSQSTSMYTVATMGIPKSRNYDYSILDKNELKVKQLLDYLKHSSIMKDSINLRNTSKTMFNDNNMSAIDNRDTSKILTPDKPKNNDFLKELSKDFPGLMGDPTKGSNYQDLKSDQNLGINFPLNLYSEQIDYSRVVEHQKTKDSNMQLVPDSPLPNQSEMIIPAGISKGYSAHLKVMNRDNNSQESIRKKSTTMKKMFKRDTTDHRMIVILNEKIRTLNYNIMLIILATYLAFSLLFQAFAGYYKYIVIREIRSDVENKIIAADLNCKEFASVVDTLQFIDLNRLVVEGSLADSLFTEAGYPSIIAQDEVVKKKSSADLSVYHWRNEINFGNLSFPSMLDEDEKYRNQKLINVEVYDMNINDFKNESRRIPSAFAYVQPLIDRYCARNLIADLLPKMSANSLDNIVEEAIRRNLAGSISLSTATKGRTLYSYFRGIGRNYVVTNTVWQISAIGSVLLVCFIVLFYTLLLRLKFRHVYQIMFGFKVGFAIKFREEMLSRRRSFGKRLERILVSFLWMREQH